jgi:F0F1-type ATP synthase assembly protein I
MKLINTNVRVNPRDSLGQGIDAVVTIIVFFGIGFLLDRWLSTTPWLSIVMLVLGAIGVFYRLKAGYLAEVDQKSDAARAERSVGDEESVA